MDANERNIALFSTRVRQMILLYEDTKKANLELIAKLEERDAEIKKLTAKLAQAHNDYNSLKMVKMLEITDGDMDGAQRRLSRLIRDVNKCITLLSEE